MSHGLLRRLFPVPRALSMHGGGIEISEGTVKFFRFDWSGGGRSVGAFGEVALPEGTMVHGEILQGPSLVEALQKVRLQCGFTLVHASLPEQKGYLFDVTLPRESKTPLSERITLSLPEHVPLSPAEAVFDCETILSESTSGSRSMVVTVLPEEVAATYAQFFQQAGFFPLSFELEPQAAARAVLWEEEHRGATLLVDCGGSKTLISIVQNGVVRFATSAEGSSAADLELEKLAVEGKNVEELKREEGLMPGTAAAKVLEPAAAALGKSIARVRVYWQSQHGHGERREAVHSIVLYGGNANIRGLAEYLARTLNTPCRVADFSRPLIDGGGRVPPLHKDAALRYGTVIGLALRSDAQL